MKQKHIVVVDGMWIGHHPVYLKTFVNILLVAGYKVTVLCPAPEEVSSWVKHTSVSEYACFGAHYFSDPGPGILSFIPGKVRYTLSGLFRWRHLSRSLRKLLHPSENPDLVFFAWLDSYLYGYLPVKLIDRMFPYFWSGLYFHPRHFRSLKSDGKPRSGYFAPPVNFIVRSVRAASLAVLDAGIENALRSKLHGKQVVVFPDFTDEIPASDNYHLVDEIKAKAKGRKIIGLLGGLPKRKGLLTLIRIVEQSVSSEWFFVFAGELREQTFSKDELNEINSFFNVPKENCFFHLKKIPNDSYFNALVKACDVIFAMYEDFLHSSNLITKSAIYAKSVLVSSGGYMEEVVSQYKLGEAVPAGNVHSALKALHTLTDGDHTNERLSGMKEYAMRQSQENLRSVLLGLVENSIKIASS